MRVCVDVCTCMGCMQQQAAQHTSYISAPALRQASTQASQASQAVSVLTILSAVSCLARLGHRRQRIDGKEAQSLHGIHAKRCVVTGPIRHHGTVLRPSPLSATTLILPPVFPVGLALDSPPSPMIQGSRTWKRPPSAKTQERARIPPSSSNYLKGHIQTPRRASITGRVAHSETL